MSHPDIDYMILMERRRDELAAAAHSRLVKEALAGKRAASGQRQHVLFRRLGEGFMLKLAYFLSRIGDRMIAWSCRLQTRYTLLVEDAAENQPSPCTS